MPKQPDLRTLLSDALRGHAFDGCDYCFCGYRTGQGYSAAWAEHAVDALLSLPGIAITQLPTPDDDHHDGIAFWWQSADVGVSDGMVLAKFDPGTESLWFYPELARDIAGALLAAAAAAEADHA
jgi:hypothetical protein